MTCPLPRRTTLPPTRCSSAAAAGVIFGALLTHMIPDTAASFKEYFEATAAAEEHTEEEEHGHGHEFPYNTMLIGAVFIILYAVDKLVVAHGADGHAHGAGGDHDHVSDALKKLEDSAEAEAGVQLTTTGVAVGKPAASSSAAGAGAAAAGGVTASASSASASIEERTGGESPRVEVAPGRASDCTDCALAAVESAAGATPAPTSAPGGDDEHLTLPVTEGAHQRKVLHVHAADAHTKATADVSTPVAASTSILELAAAKTKAADAAKQQRMAIVRAWVFVLALSLHAVFDGLSLGAEQNLEGFYSLVIAVCAHKAFDGLAVGAAVYPANFSFLQSMLMIGVCAAMTPIGIAIGYGATAADGHKNAVLAEAIIVSLSGGSFLFISLAELLPSAIRDGRLVAVKLGAFIAGWIALVVLARYV